MKILTEAEGLFLEKEGKQIGFCHYHAISTIEMVIDGFEITSAQRGKGYGTYLLKGLFQQTGGYAQKQETIYRITLPQPPSEDTTHFLKKFSFSPSDAVTWVRHRKPDISATQFTHTFLETQLHHPTLCIDATCGNGHDSLFLAKHLAPEGQLLCFDIQQEAITATASRLAAAGIPTAQTKLYCDSHANLAQYAQKDSVDLILFNFGWLPGADHTVFSSESSSIPALEQSLILLKKGGILSAVLYNGSGIGSHEKEDILRWMKALPLTEYTVLTCEFANWNATAPLPCFIFKK